LIKLLLDTGMRAEEVCALTFEDLNFKENSLMAKGKGPGRRPKVRKVFMSKRTAQTLWKYLLPRLETIKPTEPIFTVDSNYPRPLTRQHLSHLIHHLGVRAGVKDAHPHKFRHTFAISYLRNGGDLLTLQMLLGHTSLDMVKRYARIAEADCAAKHLQASPVDNWRL
jgi:integrase/recombinase XerD